MLGASHLFNIEKFQLFARCFVRIGKMQSGNYDLCSLKLVQISLLSEFSRGQYLTSSDSTQWSKNMYNKSLEMENDGAHPANNNNAFNENTSSTVFPGLDNVEKEKGIVLLNVLGKEAMPLNACGDIRSSLL